MLTHIIIVLTKHMPDIIIIHKIFTHSFSGFVKYVTKKSTGSVLNVLYQIAMFVCIDCDCFH